MDRPVRRAYLEMISKRVWPALKAAGFQRSSGTFRLRSGDGDAVILEFQGSGSSGGDLSLFYINMAVSTGGWLRWQQTRGFVDGVRLPRTMASQWWNRLEAPPEFVDSYAPGIGVRRDTWRLTSTGDAERCGDFLVAALPSHVLPFLEEILGHYRRIDESLRAGEVRLPPPPANALEGFHFLKEPDHPYVAWALSHDIDT
ncbi:DUF4304 domain-containing protein [Actinoplanes sp. NPDC000266]